MKLFFLLTFILASCTKNEASFTEPQSLGTNSQFTFKSITQGKIAFDSNEELITLYDSLSNLVDGRVARIVDSLENLNYTSDEINLYFDSISFDDYLPLKQFIAGKQYSSSFSAYYEDLRDELEADVIDFEYIDSTYILTDPVWMAIFNDQWQIIIADTLIDLQSRLKVICAKNMTGCCPTAVGRRSVIFNNGQNRFVTNGSFAPSWWTVAIGGPLGAGVAGFSNYNMRLIHQTRKGGEWKGTRTNLRIDSNLNGRFQHNCTARMISANNKSWKNRSEVSWTRTVHSGGLGVLFVGWDGTTQFDAVHLPTNFNLRTTLSY